MSGDAQVRFWESERVRFPFATRLYIYSYAALKRAPCTFMFYAGPSEPRMSVIVTVSIFYAHSVRA